MDNSKNWEIIVLERVVFQEQIPERPYIRHQEMEPKIKIHLAIPMEGKNKCICGDEIPEDIMNAYEYFLKTWKAGESK